tara:strand:- start:4849 stop:5139 length:291 start_codon:yes stop_codon:yes gene_type:complete
MADTTSEEILKILQGMQAAQDKAEESFDPYKGRTFIPRMSPEFKKMLVEGIRKARAKRQERKAADRLENKMGEPQDLIQNNDMFAKYGGKIKKYKG